MTAIRITVESLTKTYTNHDRPAVDHIDLEVAPGMLTALVGPSGCGKTTTLKLIAGLLDPDAGDVRLDGVSIIGLPAERRSVGVVFQKPLLFPHLTAADNIGFGLRIRGVSRPAIRARVAEMLDLVMLPGYGDRRVSELSGGQEQRVALARALVIQPDVLLLDEPLSQLDAALRLEMRDLVSRLQRTIGAPRYSSPTTKTKPSAWLIASRSWSKEESSNTANPAPCTNTRPASTSPGSSERATSSLAR